MELPCTGGEPRGEKAGINFLPLCKLREGVVVSFLSRIFRRKEKTIDRSAPVVLDLVAKEVPPPPKKKEPAVSGGKYPPLAKKTPRHHARRLLEYLHFHGIQGELRPEDLKEHYSEMCFDLWWEPHAWNTIAKEFTAITSKKKVYRYFRDEKTGEKQRLRVYPVNPPVLRILKAA